MDAVARQISVPTRGLAPVDWKNLGIIGLITPSGVLAGVYLTNGGVSYDPLGKVIGTLITLAFADLVLEGILSVRGIEIDSEGVTFRYPFNRVRASWSSLRPIPYLVPGGGYFVRGSWLIAQKQVSQRFPERGHQLTREQALAVIRYPGRPPWDLTGAPWEGLVDSAHTDLTRG
jgi:hypothetical protein